MIAQMRFEKAGAINFYLTIPLLGFILYLAAESGRHFNAANLVWDMSFNANWFLPYGVWLFALSGFTVIPEVRDIMRERGIRGFKFVIWTSTLLAAAFSLLFAIATLAATGAGTTEEALTGLRGILGDQALFLGSIIGFLAVLTSYIATAQDFKEIFKTDYRMSGFVAWLLVVLPPTLIYFWQVPGLVSALSFLGAVSFGISGYFILRMSERVRCASPGITLSCYPRPLKIITGAGIIVGSIYEVYQTFI
jgi:amino acid permease